MKSFWYIILGFAVVAGMLIWFFRSTGDETMGATCMSLSNSIKNASGDDLRDVDYDTYANLKVPVLRPEQALERFELVEGFRIELVAHEPMVTDPVAMDIDADGRLWIVDMPSYMPVHDLGDWETAALEQVPEGRVVVLEDTNGDGVMDKKVIFADELVLPRAIKVLTDGILVGLPPNVWFIQDTNGDGKGDTRELVYDSYGDPTTENVEHMTNGLMWGMDNWIHSTHVNVESLRKVDGRWQIRPFHRLGQWGMTQDDWGRLYSANNVRPLLSHLVPHGYGERHPDFSVREGKTVSLAPGEPIWPAHPTGVNRGYREGELHEDGRLRRVTATGGSVIFRGAQFGEEFRGNVFVPEPAGNMIIRYTLEDDPSEIEAEAHFAYEGREFLTSTDERFRPVNMYNAPDGTLYVVDMYRGLFQHARFLTDYLRDYTVAHDLQIPTGQFGRIYRIVRDDRPVSYDTPRFSEMTPVEVAEYLRNENGQLRDQAQQILVQCSPVEAIPLLENLVHSEAEEAWTRLQALWTLEGFDRSVYGQEHKTRQALQALGDSHPRVRAAAVRILEPAVRQGASDVLTRFEDVTRNETSPFVRLQLLATLGESRDESSLNMIAEILNTHSDSPYFREMALTGVFQREVQLAEILRDQYGWNEESGEGYKMVLESLDAVGKIMAEADLSHFNESELALFERGKSQYRTCAGCHGQQGEGLNGVATPLARSQWVQQDPEVITRILLQGFDGGAAEMGVTVFDAMPGHSFLSDEDVAAILTFIRQSWGNNAPPIDPRQVARIREQTAGRNDAWSPDELRALPN